MKVERDIIFRIELTEEEAGALRILVGKTSQSMRRGMGMSGEMAICMSELYEALSGEDDP